MRAAARGRLCLKGRWKSAIAVQLTGVAAAILLLGLELLILWLAGLAAEEIVHVADWTAGPRLWLHAGVILGVTALDLFLISPLLIGQASFFYRLAEGQEQPARHTCAFQTVRFPADIDSLLSDTHEFVPVSAIRGDAVPVRSIWSFYGQGYWRTVGWRAALWGWRSLYALFCYAPAALLWGYSEVLRVSGDISPFTDVTRLFCGLFGLFALCAGWVAQQLLMLRYMPAQYLVAQGRPLRGALREARRLMRGQLGAMAWLYLGFAGWLAACLLAAPYLYAAPLFQTTRAAAVRRLPAPAASSVRRRETRPVRHRRLRRRTSG